MSASLAYYLFNPSWINNEISQPLSRKTLNYSPQLIPISYVFLWFVAWKYFQCMWSSVGARFTDSSRFQIVFITFCKNRLHVHLSLIQLYFFFTNKILNYDEYYLRSDFGIEIIDSNECSNMRLLHTSQGSEGVSYRNFCWIIFLL